MGVINSRGIPISRLARVRAERVVAYFRGGNEKVNAGVVADVYKSGSTDPNKVFGDSVDSLADYLSHRYTFFDGASITTIDGPGSIDGFRVDPLNDSQIRRFSSLLRRKRSQGKVN